MEIDGEELCKLKEKAAAFFRSRPEVVFAILFGSYSTGKITPLSDVDLAIYVDQSFLRPSRKSFDLCCEFTSELTGLLKQNDIDLVLLNEAPPLLRHRIMTRGESLMSRNPLLEQRFLVRTLHEYFDTEPIRQIQMRYLKEYLKELRGPESERSNG